ncbi:MAG: CCA tRNA nucleotidyltransferase [Gudongella sp.]|nr:CCA tRNA nucleotidyltransferase [Gudongella sp.]
MEISIPDYIEKIIDRIEEAGYTTYLVGGCVRDFILGKPPVDYDLATSATPIQILTLFKDKKTVGIGSEYGTVIIVEEKGNVEVTTYRTEGIYVDGRRPENVSFTHDILEDLRRRDFTINAMAYHPKRGFLDPYNGTEDIRDSLVRCVGNPRERLSEDHLRILRAVRFATQLDFLIDIKTSEACMNLAPKLEMVSIDRIRDEFFKIILSEKPSRGFLLMRSLGILKEVIPELIPAIGFDQRNPYHDRSVFQHTLTVMDNTPPVLHIRLAALLHDIGKPYTFTLDDKGVGHFYGHDKESVKIGKEILARLNCSTQLTEVTLKLVKEHMIHHPDLKKKGLKRQLQRVGEDRIHDLIDLQIADRLSKSGNNDVSNLLAKKRAIDSILNAREPFCRRHLAIDGDDLKEMGYSQGKIIGKILEYLLNCVLEKPELNRKEALRKIAREIYPLD